jgi:hypothetical protein
VHSDGLAALTTGSTFSNPERLANNIFWQNRSYYWSSSIVPGGGFVENPDGLYQDLGVVGAAVSQLNPEYSTLTDTTGYASSNSSDDPLLVDSYFNTLFRFGLPPMRRQLHTGVLPAARRHR